MAYVVAFGESGQRKSLALTVYLVEAGTPEERRRFRVSAVREQSQNR
jgi:hypothetical protein